MRLKKAPPSPWVNTITAIGTPSRCKGRTLPIGPYQIMHTGVIYPSHEGRLPARLVPTPLVRILELLEL